MRNQGPLTSTDRAFPTRPVVGVGAVVIDRGRFLLVLRGQPPLQGQWSLPGGGVEVGETLSSAVQREVYEECGLIVSVGPMVEVLDRIHTDDEGRVEYHYVLIDYLCSVVGGDLRPQSDAADARWASVSELDALGLHPLTRRVIDKAVALASPPA